MVLNNYPKNFQRKKFLFIHLFTPFFRSVPKWLSGNRPCCNRTCVQKALGNVSMSWLLFFLSSQPLELTEMQNQNFPQTSQNQETINCNGFNSWLFEILIIDLIFHCIVEYFIHDGNQHYDGRKPSNDHGKSTTIENLQKSFCTWITRGPSIFLPFLY